MRTPAFCTRCNINWASLHSSDDEARDESYEYCPCCESDMFLEDVHEGDRYISLSFGRGIYNTTTGERAEGFGRQMPVPNFGKYEGVHPQRVYKHIEVYKKNLKVVGSEAAARLAHRQYPLINSGYANTFDADAWRLDKERRQQQEDATIDSHTSAITNS